MSVGHKNVQLHVSTDVLFEQNQPEHKIIVTLETTISNSKVLLHTDDIFATTFHRITTHQILSKYSRRPGEFWWFEKRLCIWVVRKTYDTHTTKINSDDLNHMVTIILNDPNQDSEPSRIRVPSKRDETNPQRKTSCYVRIRNQGWGTGHGRKGNMVPAWNTCLSVRCGCVLCYLMIHGLCGGCVLCAYNGVNGCAVVNWSRYLPS